jgi:hypothetical protein
MYYINNDINRVRDMQAHQPDISEIIKHPDKALFAVKVNAENFTHECVEKLGKDWRHE